MRILVVFYWNKETWRNAASYSNAFYTILRREKVRKWEFEENWCNHSLRRRKGFQNRVLPPANKSLSSFKVKLKLVEAEYEGQQNSMEALQKKQETLNKILEEQQNKEQKL